MDAMIQLQTGFDKENVATPSSFPTVRNLVGAGVSGQRSILEGSEEILNALAR